MSYRVDGEAAMINQVLSGRTLSVSLDANNMGSYESGIYRGCGVNYNVNHAMNIIGVNVEEGYWVLRNSWGTWWGDNGYMKLAMVRSIWLQQYEATESMSIPQLILLIFIRHSSVEISIFVWIYLSRLWLHLFVDLHTTPQPSTPVGFTTNNISLLVIACIRDPTCVESTTTPHIQTPPP